jgi:hypothetical protein
MALATRLQEVCSQATHALAAPMAQAITLMAPAALGLFCASSHEPFHVDGGQESMAVTERTGQKPPLRRRDLPWSNRTVEQVVALSNRALLGIKAAPTAPLARRQRRAQPLSGPSGARRATLDSTADRARPYLTKTGAAASRFLALHCPPRDHRVNGHPPALPRAIGYANH